MMAQQLASDRQLCTARPGPISLVMLLGLLARLIRWFIDGEIEAADTSVADLVVRFSVLAAVIVVAIWLFLRF
jgi:hypothetical protein